MHARSVRWGASRPNLAQEEDIVGTGGDKWLLGHIEAASRLGSDTSAALAGRVGALPDAKTAVASRIVQTLTWEPSRRAEHFDPSFLGRLP